MALIAVPDQMGSKRSLLCLREAYPEAILVAKANAGLPHMEGGTLTYDGTPEIMAGYARRARDLGATLIGHVAALPRRISSP